MILYNLRTSETGFKVTKFDDDLNPMSSYDMSADGSVCTCPRAASPTCRHRQMFAALQERVDTAWLYDFDGAKQWHDPTGAYAPGFEGVEEELEDDGDIPGTGDPEPAKPAEQPLILVTTGEPAIAVAQPEEKIKRRI